MAELGLDPAWIRYSGTDAFQPDTPLEDAVFRERFLASTGYARIARFYLAHPGRLAERVRRASPKIWSLRPSYGNLETVGPQFPTRTLTTRFAAWSRLRLAVFGAFPITAVVLLLARQRGLRARDLAAGIGAGAGCCARASSPRPSCRRPPSACAS